MTCSPILKYLNTQPSHKHSTVQYRRLSKAFNSQTFALTRLEYRYSVFCISNKLSLQLKKTTSIMLFSRGEGPIFRPVHRSTKIFALFASIFMFLDERANERPF